MIKVPVTYCSVLLASQMTVLSAHTGYVFCGTLVCYGIALFACKCTIDLVLSFFQLTNGSWNHAQHLLPVGTLI